MAKWAFFVPNWTPGAGVADGTAANFPYMAWRGGTATQYIDCLEVKITGLAGASNPTPLRLARVSSLAGAVSALVAPNGHFGGMNPFTAALGTNISGYVSATTGGIISTNVADGALDCGINAFGGILRWNAAPTQQFSTYANAASIGEAVLTCYTGGTPGLIQSHIILEPM